MPGSLPIEIVEVGPRDGLQNEPAGLATVDKIEFVRRLAAAGLRRIEVASFVDPRRVPAMADGEEVVAAARAIGGLRLSGLVLNERGFGRALAAGVDEITFVVVASETFSQRNQGATIETMLTLWRRLSAQAKEAGLHRSVAIAAAFGCPIEGEVPAGRIKAIAEHIVEAGVDELALADTIGVAVPRDVLERFGVIGASWPEVALRAHFHNTRNTGYANAEAALRAGVTVLDSSLGGLGGCPFAPGATGNIATEDLVYMLARSGIATGTRLDSLIATSHWLAERMGRRLPAQLPHVPPFPREGAQPVESEAE
ncbi:MAG: hydroxymethylglutaryl-CoA lyase [Methylobacterium sp.]|nr:MAG: hydroxymethylglutaryl-CoA lyase [Methylobacterium sp.]